MLMVEDLQDRIGRAKGNGQEVIVVLGLGFVGTAVCGNLARTEKDGRRIFFVVGIEQDTAAGREKCELLNSGKPSTYANDAKLEEVVRSAVCDKENLCATVDQVVLRYADTVVFCINLDVERAPFREQFDVNVQPYAKVMRMVGENISTDTLVTVESTLPVGMCDSVLYPALCEGRENQGVDVRKDPPLLAYCYERVMPGPEYLDSVNNYWRAFAGIDDRSSARAEAFLTQFVNVKDYPLWRHKTTRAAEMAKLLENSYRATNIAFVEEWAKLAEAAKVDLFDIVRSIRVRKGTHDNLMRPGLGVGGYCLTKDALLAVFGAEKLLGYPAEMPFSQKAIFTNERMPLRSVDWAREHFGSLEGKRALLVGVTYRPDVADTRSSPAEAVARELQRQGCEVSVYDPLVTKWEEMPGLEMHATWEAALNDRDLVVLCLPDARYKNPVAELMPRLLHAGSLVIDAWNVVGEEAAARLAGCGVCIRVYGRGDMPASDKGR